MIGIIYKTFLGVCFILMFVSQALAELEARDLSPGDWTQGIHLLAGGGVNTSVYSSDSARHESELGLNLTTHLGYYMNHSWAAEFGSSVGFSRIEGVLLWNTFLTLGARVRLPEIEFFPGSDCYMRLFFGRAATVLFPTSDAALPLNRDVDRIQFDGGVGGMSVGAFRKLENGQMMFVELTATLENLEKSTGVRDHEEVPAAVFEVDIEDHSRIFEISLAIGLQAF